MAQVDDFIEFTKISGNPTNFDKTRGVVPTIRGTSYQLTSQALASGVIPALATGEKDKTDVFNKNNIGTAEMLTGFMKKFGGMDNGTQAGTKALMAGWQSGGLGGMASALFGGGATSLLGPIAGGLSGLAEGYMSKRTQDKADKVAQQNADTNTLNASKSPGGFRWDDPGNTPDKYLDGTVTKGNFFNPGGLLGKRTA